MLRFPLQQVHALIQRIPSPDCSSLTLPGRLPVIPATAPVLVARARLVHVRAAKFTLPLRTVPDSATELSELASGLLVEVGGRRVVVGVAAADAGRGVEAHCVGAGVFNDTVVAVEGHGRWVWLWAEVVSSVYSEER